jgi:hypothetical protein
MVAVNAKTKTHLAPLAIGFAVSVDIAAGWVADAAAVADDNFHLLS